MPRAQSKRKRKAAAFGGGKRNLRPPTVDSEKRGSSTNTAQSGAPAQAGGSLCPLADLVRSSSDAVIFKSLTGTIQSWDEGAERIYGYPAAEVLGQSIAVLDPEGEHGSHRLILDEIRAGREVSHLETVRVRKDGEKIVVDLCVFPVRNEQGEAIGACVAARDLSHRRSAENCLRASEDNYRLLFQNNPIPMLVYNTDSLEVMAVNQSAILQYGYTEREFLALRVPEIHPAEEAQDLIEHLNKGHSRLGEPKIWRHRRKNGTVFDVEIVAHVTEYLGMAGKLVAAYDVTERLRSQSSLEESEAKYRILFEDSTDACWLMDASGCIDCNAAALEMFGFDSPADFTHPGDISPPHQSDGTSSHVAANLKMQSALSHGCESFEWLHRRKNGEVFPADVILSSLQLRGRPMLLANVRDISSRRRAEQEHIAMETAVREAEEKFRSIFENAVIGIFRAAPEGRPVAVNRALAQIYGYNSPEELLQDLSGTAAETFIAAGQLARRLLVESGQHARSSEVRCAEVHRAEVQPADVPATDIQTAKSEGTEVEFFTRSGERRWIRLNCHPVHDQVGGLKYVDGTIEDITDRKLAEKRIETLAYYDALTGLANRSLLDARIVEALAMAQRTGKRVAVLFLDLDRFKPINDSRGHSIGDMVLRETAHRLSRFVRGEDAVARVGGDEFVLVMGEIDSVADVEHAARRILDDLSQPLVIDGQALHVSASIGVSLYPENGFDRETLIRYADQAMYAAKESGRNRCRFFSAELNEAVQKRATIEQDLRAALGRGEFFLSYQPQMKIQTGEMAGMEALLRWQHPTMGLVPLDLLIDVAESTGLILPIGEWVLKTACRQAKTWLDAGWLTVPVAVNISAVQFRQADFCSLIADILKETGLPAGLLELELTETLLLSTRDSMFSVLEQLRAMGVHLAIDDFGTGYSSLSYLKQFRVHKLKIDRSFVHDIPVDADDSAITTAIIDMGKNLNLRVIAEGVEEESQLRFLRNHRCDEIQGYIFSKPLAAGKMETFLFEHSRPMAYAAPARDVANARLSAADRMAS